MNILIDIFVWKSFLSGLFLSIIFTLLGIFIINKRLSFLSDGLAHASLTGLALGALLNVSPFFIATLTSIIFSMLIRSIQKKTKIHTDTLIGIIFTFGFSLGLILLLFSKKYQRYVLNYLLGDILSLGTLDFLIVVIIFLLIIYLLLKFKNILFLWLIDEDYLKIVSKYHNLLEIIFYIFLASIIILGIKFVGVILVSALLIIPPATARLISKSFYDYLIKSLILGILGFVLGFFISFIINLPTGPTIVILHSLIFFLIFLFVSGFRYNK